MKVRKSNRTKLRFVGVVAALWVAIMVLTIAASALDVTGLDVGSPTGEGAWDGSSLSVNSGSCMTGIQQKTTSLTLTNSGFGTAVLSFDFSMENLGTLKIDGTEYKNPDHFSKELTKGASVKIELTSHKDNQNTTKVTLTSVSLEEIVSIDVTFKPGVYYTSGGNGEITTNYMGYTVNDAAVAANGKAEFKDMTNTVAYTLTQTPDNYHLLYAIDETGKYWYAGADGSLTFATNENIVVTPHFIYSESSEAPFLVSGAERWSWESAMGSASGGMVVVNTSNTLPTTLLDSGLNADGQYVSIKNGVLTYTVPTGTKLLIPYGSGDTTGSFGGAPNNYISQAGAWDLFNEGGMKARNFTHRCLTVPAGTKIDCYGSINVNGQWQETGQPYIGVSVGGYGKLQLNGAGTEQLTVHGGGFLYAYGYITGSGKVNVLSGGEVHELMQICDWPGGGNANSWRGNADENTLFLLSQYYIQNIETTLQINSGAMAYAEVTIHGASQTIARSAPYIGSSTGLFRLESNSYIVRKYNTGEDRVEYVLHGTASLGEISVTFDYGIMSYTLNSSSYVMPINGNMTLRVAEGTMSFDQRAAFLPGSQLIIDEGATVNMGGQVHIVDVNDFTKSYFFDRSGLTSGNSSPQFNALPYVATRDSISPRTNKLVLSAEKDSKGETLKQYYLEAKTISASALVQVDGTLNVSGQLLTTNKTSSPSANKAITGSGVINYTSTPAVTNLKGGESGTINTMTSTYGLANIVGEGLLQPIDSAGTYYGFYADADNNGTEEYWWSTNERTFIVHLMLDGSTEVETRCIPMYDGFDVTAYYTDAACTTKATSDFAGTDLYAIAEAKIVRSDETLYALTLQSAVQNATRNGDQVYLLRDTAVDKAIKIEASQNIGIYLNGHTITYTTTVFDNYGVLNLDFQGGSMKSGTTVPYSAVVANQKGGTLDMTLNGGTLLWSTSTKPSKGPFGLVYNYSGGTANIDLSGGTVNLEYKYSKTYGYEYRFYAIYNCGTMDLRDSVGTGLLTGSYRGSSSFATGGTTRGWPLFSAPLMNQSGTLTAQNLHITDTSASGSYAGCIINYHGTIKELRNVTMKSNYHYGLVNNGGTINSIVDCQIDANSYGIYNSSTYKCPDSSKADDFAITKQGNIKAITDTNITVSDTSAILNLAQIGTIGGSSVLKAKTATIHVDDIVCGNGSKMITTTTDDAGNTVKTYNWTQIPAISKITDSVTITATSYNAITNEGTITEISGNVSINTNAASSSSQYAVGILNGGYIGAIKESVSINSSGHNAVYLSGHRVSTETTDVNGTKTTSYDRTSGIGSISGAVITAKYNTINNAGNIEKIEDGTVVLATADSADYYALKNTGSIELISGGNYYHPKGASNIVNNSGTLNYPDGKGISEDTQSVTVNDKPYDCHYITDVHTHDYSGKPAFDWKENGEGGYTVTATLTCGADGCPDEPITGDATVTSEVTKNATCTELGKELFTAKVKLNEQEYEGTKEVDIPALGHTYGELITKQDEVHTKTELKASVAAHYQCSVCAKYFTEEKAETTLENLTGKMPEHTYDVWINTDPENHWQECSVCRLKSGEAAHSDGDDADANCDTCGRELHTHDYNIRGDVVTPGNCQTETIYQAKCSCGEVSGTITGEKDTSKHTGELIWTQTAEKHTQSYSCCDAVTVAEENHEWSNGNCSECAYVCTHKDDDLDHICDYGCGVYQGVHADAADDDDHVCDYGCKEVLEDCSDVTTDSDHDCDVCGKENVSGHSHTSKVTAPTCVDKGYTTYTCNCGDTYQDNYVDAAGHSLSDWIVDEEADCENVGSKHKECANCDYIETEEIPAKGHTEGTVVVENNVAASCTAEGSYDNVVYCTVCKAELSRNTVTVDKISHTPAATVEENRVESTCTKAGSYDEVVYCSECGEELSRNTVALELAAHTEGAVVVENEKAATCTAEGSYDNVVYCTVCNKELSRTTVVVDKAEHSYEAVTTPPTYNEEGYTTHTCSVCGDNYKDSYIPVLQGVAAIDGYNYGTLQEAIDAANGKTVTVLKDIALNEGVTVAKNLAVTLDLNGCAVSYTTAERGKFLLTNNGELTITDNSGNAAGKLSFCFNGAADPAYSTMNGTVQNTGKLVIKNGTVENTSAAMSHANYAINTNAGAALTVNGGKILNQNGHAVRQVSFGTVKNTVYINGGYIEGTRAINVQLPSSSADVAPEMVLNITGGELKSNEATYNLAVYAYSSGSSAEKLSMSISGGIFNGNVAVNGSATKTMAEDAVSVTNGTFNGEYGVFSYAADNIAVPVISITGGTFATKESELYAEDDGYIFTANSDNTYGVKAGAYVAETDGKKYETLADAVAAAENGSTVTLLSNAIGAGMMINKNITIDFDGHTYILNKAVGSAGTETLGFQILKDNNVTLKNGTLTSTAVTSGKEVKVLIQNYANLTLTDMELNGTNENIQYGLSNNSGNIALNGNTDITVHESAVAFDVYDYSAAGYAVPSMTVDTTGKITGKIEVSETASLAISGGTFTVEIEEKWCAEGFTPAKVGDFYTVGTLPNAEIKNLGYVTVEEYQIYNGSLTEGTDPIDLQVAMEFIAKDNAEQAAANTYGQYITDFYITMDGISNGSFTADGCYLAGHYGDFGWIMVPLDGMLIEEGKIYPVITSVGFNFTYEDICTSVKDFKCGIYFSNEVIQNNPDMRVTLTLGLSENMDKAQAADFITVDAPYTYEVRDMLRVAEVNGTKYATLAEAVAAAKAGDTVTLLTDASGAGVVIDKDITIDFDDHTYTLNKAVGSAGTETLGFQILKDNDVTLKNGTLTSTAVTSGKEVKVLIQNYANLTLTDMDLIGNNENIQYGLSNNSGNIALNGNTDITVHDGAVAFDVYDYSAAGYAVPSMKVNTTGKISGMLEVSENASLAISGGTFTAKIEEKWCAEGFTPAKVGDFYTVGTLPNAEIKNLGYITVEEYRIFSNGLTEGGDPIDLQVAMEFIAKDTPEQAAANTYGQYITDFYITMDGISNGSFTADGCYLAGHYGDFGWIMVPLDGMLIEEGKIYPVITSVGFNFTYEDICTSVKDFKCGIYFSNEVIQNNPDMKVSLTLGLSEDKDKALAADYITVDKPYVYELKDMLRVAEVNGTKYATLAEAVNAANNGDTIKVLADIQLTDPVVATGKTVDFNGYTVSGTLLGTLKLNGGTLITAEGKKMAGPDADYYQTTDAMFTMDAAMNINVLSGTMTLVPDEWWTLPGQKLEISEGACFVIPAGKTLQVRSEVIVKGAVTIDGTVNLHDADATVTTTIENLNIITTAGDKVWYTEGKYVVHTHTPGAEATCTEDQTCTLCDDVLKEATGHTLTQVEAKAPTCTEIGWEAYEECSVCDYTTYVEIAAEGHSYESEVTAPTCTEDGYTTYTCSVCDDTYTADVVGAVGHNYSTEVTTDPTCTEKGVKTFTCANCGDTYTEEIAANGHTLTQVKAKAPTCTEIGWEAYEECSVCDYTTYVEIEAKGHSYESEVTAPTCTAEGYTTYTCSVCKDSYVADKVDALGHTDAEAVKEKEVAATCTEAGSYESVVYCSVCGTEVSREKTTVNALGHTEGEAVTENEKAATCTADGSYDTVVNCTVCDAELSRVTTVVPASGHSYDNGVETKAPTCTEEGVKTFTCGTCGDTYTEAIEAAGHKESSSVTAPTCTEKGYTTVTCSVCGNSYTTSEVPAKGHAWVEADCDTPKTCSVCGETEGEPTGEHTYKNGVCTDCGAQEPVTEINVNVEIVGEANKAQVTAPENGWQVGTNTFYVTNDLACVVVVSYNNGETYECLPATADGARYKFTADNVTEDTLIKVALKGDADMDGIITAQDAVKVLKASLEQEDLNELQKWIANVDTDAVITAQDAVKILRVSLQLESF